VDRTKHIVGFSGGIDSQACAAVVLDKYGPDDVILTNSNAGENEDPLTDEFVDWYSANVHPVVRVNALVRDMWVTPGFAETRGFRSEDVLTFTEMVQIKGRAPSRKAQFCSEILKIRPQMHWVREQFGPGGPYSGWSFERYTGVRRDESDARKDTPDHEWDDYFDCTLHHPIAAWTKQECFDFVLGRGEKINPLYAMGFNRVGCAPCINSSKDDIANWEARRPEMIAKIREMERVTGVTYFAPCIPGAHMNTVGEVVEWAKTARGGKQYKMDFGRPACASKYGLCE
jgi:3'-phosphoadenosine 5'-phosphosulfate sulfotransferase (PAPS reductase)/FAD synthetase